MIKMPSYYNCLVQDTVKYASMKEDPVDENKPEEVTRNGSWSVEVRHLLN